MHVALVLHESPANRTAGVELYTLALAQELQRAGHRVTCVYPRPAPGAPIGDIDESEVDGVRFAGFSVPIRPDLASRFRDDAIGEALGEWLTRDGADIVHFHHLIGFTASAIEACKTRGLPTIMTIHDSWYCCNQCHLVRYDGHLCKKGPESAELCAKCLLERVPQLAERFPLPMAAKIMSIRTKYIPSVLSEADKLLANSMYTRDNMLRAGMAEDKILLAPLGIPEFTPLPRRERTGPLRVGYLGNIQYKKGVDIFLNALAQLEPGLVNPTIRGSILQPEYAEACGASNTYSGPYTRDELPSILSELDVLCAPSREESFGMVVREAFLAGIPVIASDIPAFSEVIEHGVNGMLFPPNDALALSALLKNCAQQPDLLQRLEENIPPIQTIPEDARKLQELYKTLVTTSN